MLFNSLDFCLFFPLVWLIFTYLPTQRIKANLLLTASLFFYGYWNWHYLFLLLLTSTVDFWAARKISASNEPNEKRTWLILSILSNLCVLGFFKYGFFLGSQLAGWGLVRETPAWLEVILPVGISFYTFQAMAYVLDVYRNRLPAESSYPDFLLFISFFPQLVAGPIERAPHLLGQLKNLKTPEKETLIPAIVLIGRGFWKKLFIADRLAVYVDTVFNQPQQANSAQIILATVFFGFQIYGDFSGYSDIARGLARFFGIDLMLNFNRPHFAHSLQDFWRRWHISLSGWFRDYVYHPLGGGRNGNPYLNLLIVFGLSGFWHGANWTFLIWGLWHGLGLVVERMLVPKGGFPGYRVLVLAWVFAGWFIFRVNSLTDMTIIGQQLFQFQGGFESWNLWHSNSEGLLAVLGIAFLLLLEARQETWKMKFENIPFPLIQWSLIGIGFFLLLWFGKFKGEDFIYFQF